MYYTKSNSSSIAALITSLLFPFFGLIYSISNWRSSWSKNIFWITCIYMGAIQIFNPEGMILGTGGDSGRYVLWLQEMHNSIISFNEISNRFYDGSTLDIYSPTITFIISRFTDNGHIFFMVIATVFGFFYSRNIWYILDKLPDKLRYGSWVFIAFLFLICPIWLINGVRMWTAVHIFVFGALPYLIEGNNRRLLWCPVSLLIHHSFIFPVALILLFSTFSRKFFSKCYVFKCLFIFYLITLTVNQLDLPALNHILTSILPDYYDGRINGYVNADRLNMINELNSQNSFHVKLFNSIQRWSIHIFAIFSFFTIKRNINTQNWILPLFSFALLISGISNIFSCIPSGGRFIILSNMFMVPVFLFVINLSLGKYFKTLLPILLFLLAFSLIFDIRKGLEFYGYTLFFGNFLSAFFVESNVPLIYYIKFL